MSIQIFGLPVSRGVAIGRAVLVAEGRQPADVVDVRMGQPDGLERQPALRDGRQQARQLATRAAATHGKPIMQWWLIVSCHECSWC